MLTKNINDELNRWRDSPSSLVGKLNIIKMLMVPMLIYKYNNIPKLNFFEEFNKYVLIFIYKNKNPHVAKSVF